MAAPRRPDPPPLRTNDYAPVIVGTAVWGVAFVILLIEHSHLSSHGRGWWVWVGLSGLLLGLWGLCMLSLHEWAVRRAAGRAAKPSVEVGLAEQQPGTRGLAQ
jgi:Protein of unknown function (DUF2530)